MSAIPDPPLLPPPTRQGSRAKDDLRIEENEESSRIKGIQEQCSRVIMEACTQHRDIGDQHWLLFNVDVRPKLQGRAPRCGLVALSMAAEMARISNGGDSKSHLAGPKNTLKYNDEDFEAELTALFNLAKHLSFTSEGEMFSARNLATLAHEFYGLKTSVTDNAFDDIERILNHLLDGNPILVPYDAAPNHEPCLSKGHKSHWALLTGVLCAVEGSTDLKCTELRGSNFNVHVEQNTTTIHVVKNPGVEMKRILLKTITSPKYLLARQPKSRHVAIWPLSSLKESNSNLFELNKNRENASKFVLPHRGVREGLCKKLIYLNY